MINFTLYIFYKKHQQCILLPELVWNPQNILSREAKNVDLIIDENGTFKWKIASVRRLFTKEGLKHHIVIINRNYDNRRFFDNLTKQMIKIFVI